MRCSGCPCVRKRKKGKSPMGILCICILSVILILCILPFWLVCLLAGVSVTVVVLVFKR